MVADSGVDVVVASRSVVKVLPESVDKIVIIEDVWDILAENDAKNFVRPTIGADDLAYVMYTSGSTGQPKGVAVTHRGFPSLVQYIYEAFGHITPHRVLQHTSMNFDISVMEYISALLCGSTLVLADPDVKAIGADLVQILLEQEIEIILLTPTALATLPEKLLPHLHYVGVGGEACPIDLARNWSPGREFFNGYGPTESTIFVSIAKYESDLEHVHIGRSVADARLLVLDSRMQVVPVGVAGELYVGGPGLARGYIGRADLTAEAFVADPFADDGSRLYRTGDRVRLLPSGDLEWLGRIDQQVKIRGFRIELGEIEQALEQHQNVRQAVVLVDEEGPSKRLVAFVALHESVSEEALRKFAGERLPGYMIPSAIVAVDALPLGATGKVDRRLLAGMIPAGDRSKYVAARTTGEEKLAMVWGEVLGLGGPAGIYDDFFALGGDSILSLQVVFRARQEGIHLTVKQLFEHPTVAELASVVDVEDTETVHAEQGIVMGPVELTPIQRWFFSRKLANPDYFNQSAVVGVPAEVKVQDWECIISRLIEHHDSFRTRFVYEDGDWQAEIAGMPEALPFKVVDTAGLEADDRIGLMERIGREAQAGMKLDSPPLLQAVLFTGWDTDENRLLLAAHHLVVDVVSWRIILEDLETLIEAVKQGIPLSLPAKTTSWRQWASQINVEAGSDETAAESEFWDSQTLTQEHGLPLDRQDVSNTVARSKMYDAVLDAEDTQALLKEIPAVFGTQVNDVLLTAVGAAIGAWAGSDVVRMDLEGHGREALLDNTDVSRTVGWFTTISPVQVPAASEDSLVEGLKQVKELMRLRPRNGIGYGLLATRTGGREGDTSQVSFNYLGQFNDVGGRFVAGMGMAGPDWDPRNERPYLIDIVGQVSSGKLHLKWDYSSDAFDRTTIERVAEHAMLVLRKLVIAARDPKVQGYTPSDFPVSGMTQKQIDFMIAQVSHLPVWDGIRSPRPLLDCYPQTPIQQGLWFQSRLAADEGVYHVQAVFAIEQDLNTGALRRAWAEVMRHHSVLRTSFWEDETGQAFQLVWDLSEPPIEERDWSRESDKDRLLEDYLDTDRTRGFDPSEAPQWRILLAKTGMDAYQMVWSIHHAIIDGWSMGLVLNDLTNTYDALVHETVQHKVLPASSYRDYVTWLGKQELDDTEAFWRTYLYGFDQPTPLPMEMEDTTVFNKISNREEYWIGFSQDLTEQLIGFAQENSLTLNTVMQGAWAILLGRYAGVDDVVFGTVVSGRAGDVADIERIVGLFINTLPLRVHLPDQRSVIDWLHELQDTNLRVRQYEHTPLNLIRGWTDLSSGTPLFDTLFDFENYPMEDRKESLNLKMTRSEERINYAISLVVMTHEVIEICVQYDTTVFTKSVVDLLLKRLTSICKQFLVSPEQVLGRVGLLSKMEQMNILSQNVSHKNAIVNDDTDLQDFLRYMNDPNEIELLERLLSEIQEE